MTVSEHNCCLQYNDVLLRSDIVVMTFVYLNLHTLSGCMLDGVVRMMVVLERGE